MARKIKKEILRDSIPIHIIVYILFWIWISLCMSCAIAVSLM